MGDVAGNEWALDNRLGAHHFARVAWMGRSSYCSRRQDASQSHHRGPQGARGEVVKLGFSGPGIGPEDEDDNSPTQPLERPSFADVAKSVSETRIRVDAHRASVDARCKAIRKRAAR